MIIQLFSKVLFCTFSSSLSIIENCFVGRKLIGLPWQSMYQEEVELTTQSSFPLNDSSSSTEPDFRYFIFDAGFSSLKNVFLAHPM